MQNDIATNASVMDWKNLSSLHARHAQQYVHKVVSYELLPLVGFDNFTHVSKYPSDRMFRFFLFANHLKQGLRTKSPHSHSLFYRPCFFINKYSFIYISFIFWIKLWNKRIFLSFMLIFQIVSSLWHKNPFSLSLFYSTI